MKHPDFVQIRKKAELEARQIKEKTDGHREIVLSEIYKILEEKYDIDKIWQQRECELELDLTVPNRYIYEIYRTLLDLDKTIIFTCDMYLPKNIIIKMLEKNGFNKFEKLYLSNECCLRKGDGKLQQLVLKDYVGKKIIHIGDSINGDVNKSIEVGMPALYNPDSHFVFRESDMDNLGGSFYRALIQHTLNNGLWDKNIYFEHGFRVGGILVFVNISMK